MQRSQVTAIVITLVLLAAIGWRLHRPDQDAPPTGTPAAVPAATIARQANELASPTASAVAQRLAGVALGTNRYAVVEQPDGTTALYRAGDEVPGLGRIVDVTEDSATFEGPDGRIHLRVKAPPSATPAPPTEAVAATPAGATRSSGRDRSATESPPSSAPGQPAS